MNLKEGTVNVIDIKGPDNEQDIKSYGADALFGHCPVCGKLVCDTWNDSHCGDCGQKIGWRN